MFHSRDDSNLPLEVGIHVREYHPLSLEAGFRSFDSLNHSVETEFHSFEELNHSPKTEIRSLKLPNRIHVLLFSSGSDKSISNYIPAFWMFSPNLTSFFEAEQADSSSLSSVEAE